MKNIMFNTIRAGAILGIMFFASVNQAFAAPMLAPLSVTHITGTSATLVGKVSNIYKTSTVWIEWNMGPYISYAPTRVATQSLYDNGIGASFETNLTNLIPGQVYSYRAVATEGGMTTYSPVSSFISTNPNTLTQTSTTYQSGSQNGASTGVINPTPVKTTTPAPVVKTPETVASEVVKTTDGFTNNNNNSALVLGSGSDMLPTTLLGWLALLIAVLIMVIVAHMIYEAPEKRKKELEKKKLEEEKKKLQGKGEIE